jgi:hypothetical protein
MSPESTIGGLPGVEGRMSKASSALRAQQDFVFGELEPPKDIHEFVNKLTANLASEPIAKP